MANRILGREYIARLIGRFEDERRHSDRFALVSALDDTSRLGRAAGLLG